MNIISTNQKNIPSQGATDAILGIIDLYSIKSKNILIQIAFFLCMPFIILFFVCVIIYINRKMRAGIAELKTSPIKTEDEYNQLSKLREATAKAKQQKEIIKDLSHVPFYIRPFLKPAVVNVNIMADVHDILNEKLFILPKGVSPKQIEEAAKLNKGIEDLFDNDEEEYDYAKDFALGNIKFIERK